MALAIFFLIRHRHAPSAATGRCCRSLDHRRGGAAFHRHLRAGQYRPPQSPARADAGRDCGACCAGGGVSPTARRPGACAALMLAVGMETLPYVAVAGLYVALCFLVGGRAQAAWRPASARLSRSSARSPSSRPFRQRAGWRPSATPIPIPQFAIAAIAGAGLRRPPASPPLRQRFATRLAALAGIGVAAAAIVVLFFPQCLADPYAALDPRLKTFWLDAIVEAQPIWSMLTNNPAMAAELLCDAADRPRRCSSAGCAAAACAAGSCSSLAFLAAAIAVSVWQVRGSMFAIPLATIPLAPGSANGGAQRRGQPAASPATLRMVLRLAGFAQRRLERAANARRRRARRAAVAGRRELSAGTLRPRLRLRGAGRVAGDHRACHLQSRRADPRAIRIIACWPGHTTAMSPAICWRSTPSWAARRRPPRSPSSNGVGLVVLCRGNDETAPGQAGAGRVHRGARRRQRCRAGSRRYRGSSRRAARNLPRPAGHLIAARHFAHAQLTGVLIAVGAANILARDTFPKRFAGWSASKALQEQEENEHDVWRRPDQQGDFGSGVHRSADRARQSCGASSTRSTA